MARQTAPRYHVTDLSDIEGIPLAPRPAVLFFGHPSYTYGHLARSHKIARCLVRQARLDAYVVSPCPEFAPGEDLEAVHEVLLPGFSPAPGSLPDRLPIVDPVSPLPHVSPAALSGHRGQLLRGLVAHLRPCAVLLEGFPLVRPTQAIEECGPALAFLRAESPATLRSGGFNGVPIGMYAIDQASLIEGMLRDSIDLLFVYVDDAERSALFQRCPYLGAVERKIRFVGYVGSAPPEPVAASPRILATFGGGVDAYRKIVLVCEAFLELTGRQPGWTLHVVTGGQLPESGYQEIVRRYAGTGAIRVSRFVVGLSRQLNHFQLVISMGGYNACTELYAASTRSIVLPRIAPNFAEQLEQARKFQKAGAVDHVVDAERTSPVALADLIEQTLAAPPSPRLALDMGGAETTARILVHELKRRGALA